MAQTTPPTSNDGLWFWDGSQWRSLVSTDGLTIWNGTAWVPRLDGATAVPTQPPAPLIDAVPAPTPAPQSAAPATPAEPRPSWLPADAAWPPATFSASPPPPPGGLPPPAPVDWAAVREQAYGPPASAARVLYAGFWIRLLASVVDGLIVGIPITVVSVALVAPALATSADPAQLNAITAPVQLLGLVASFGYFVYFWSTGATLGMRLVGVRVADATTLQTISPGKAVLRYVGYLVASFCCYIGLIWAAFDSRKQGWHDKIAGTVVVHRS